MASLKSALIHYEATFGDPDADRTSLIHIAFDRFS